MMGVRHQGLGWGLMLVGLAACGGGTEADFVQGRAENPCIQSLPACPGLFAACSLNDKNYARVTFPGTFSFLVDAEESYDIEVMVFFSDPRDAGRETQILWHEPGCTDVYVYDSAGRDLFDEARGTGFVSETEQVFESGEHLLEIISDMQADVIVAVNVIVPGT